MKPVARFVIRGDGDNNPIIGKAFNNVLKPDHIYQIEECLGELVIKDMGVSFITGDAKVLKKYHNNQKLSAAYSSFPTWAYDFNWIFLSCKEFILTLQEAITFAENDWKHREGYKD